MMYKKLKHRMFSILSMRMVYNGYTIKAAMKWKRSTFSNFFKDYKTNIFFKIKSYIYGYLPNQMRILKINKRNKNKYISYKKYLYLNGSNGKYSKWLADIITTDKILKKFRKNMVEVYYQIYMRDGKIKIISIKKGLDNTEEGIIEFIKKQKRIIFMNSNYTNKVCIEYKNSNFYFDGIVGDENVFIELINNNVSKTRSLVLIEDVQSTKNFTSNNKNIEIYLKVYNKNGLEPLIGDMYCSTTDDYLIDNDFVIENADDENVLESYSVKNYLNFDEEENKKILNKLKVYFDVRTGKFKFSFVATDKKVSKLKETVLDKKSIDLVENSFNDINNLIISIFKTIPQIEIAGIVLTITDEGIKILNIYNNPAYCDVVYFDKDFSDFLKYKYEQKKVLYKNIVFKFKIFRKKLWLKLCKAFAIICYPKGLVPYISFRWLRDIKNDFFENKNISIGKKFWAYRHGFLSYRLVQYGITKKNYKNFISDFEYKWLRHIDNYYKIWFEDKVTIKYVASDYNRFLPKYYYFVSLRQGENQIIPMMDCPEEYGNTYDDILNLIKKEGDIALKRDKGSHGEGFYRLTWKNNKLYLNLVEATKEDLIDILKDKSNEYLITEYIKQADVLNKIYDGSVNTIRVVVFKKDGVVPTIGNTYMRFGSLKTGTVDNLGAGGIHVNLDEKDGHFHDALIITDDLKIVSCKEHPDSHLLIDGYIPNWDKILKNIIEISSYFEQIEYFGFDIAVTENGMKFPEINRYPDYMKIGKLKSESINYLLGKVEQKKKNYGYDKKMPHKLFKFIDRRKKGDKK